MKRRPKEIFKNAMRKWGLVIRGNAATCLESTTVRKNLKEKREERTEGVPGQKFYSILLCGRKRKGITFKDECRSCSLKTWRGKKVHPG